jgi:hypothetical protein
MAHFTGQAVFIYRSLRGIAAGIPENYRQYKNNTCKNGFHRRTGSFGNGFFSDANLHRSFE